MIEKEIGREIEMERNNWRELRERGREGIGREVKEI